MALCKSLGACAAGKAWLSRAKYFDRGPPSRHRRHSPPYERAQGRSLRSGLGYVAWATRPRASGACHPRSDRRRPLACQHLDRGPAGGRYCGKMVPDAGVEPRSRPILLDQNSQAEHVRGRRTVRWCPTPDSNRHAFRHWGLRPARLPVSPVGQVLVRPFRLRLSRGRPNSCATRLHPVRGLRKPSGDHPRCSD